MTRESTTSARKLKVAERRAFVFRLRARGKPYSEIAAEAILHFGLDRLPKGYDSRYAYKDVIGVLKVLSTEVAENASEVRRLEVSRLDFMLNALWPKIEAGQTGAIGKGLDIMKRRASLFGLDAPTKIAPVTPDGKNPYLASEMRESLMQKLRNIARGEKEIEKLENATLARNDGP